MTSKRVAVLGAGIQGTCTALELARRGVLVDLYERNSTCLSEASALNEGKIHLGFVYARDRTLKTARLAAKAGLSFQPLMRRWVGQDIDTIPVSDPFHYVVHRNGLIDSSGFAEYGTSVSGIIKGLAAGRPVDYFGQDPTRLSELLPASAYDGLYDPATVAAVYHTSEISLDPEALATLLRQRLFETPEIRLLLGRKAVSVAKRYDELIVHSVGTMCEHAEPYDHVVNASWAGRLQLDDSMGIRPKDAWTFRFKYFARTNDAGHRLAATIVLGPFGDIASYTNGVTYLSWYSAGMVGRSSAIEPPDLPATLVGSEKRALATAIASGLSSVILGAPRLDRGSESTLDVKGGWIFAWGTTDIDDPQSRFHERCDVGVHAYGRYLSVDTGKFTMAPLFAVEAADVITGNAA